MKCLFSRRWVPILLIISILFSISSGMLIANPGKARANDIVIEAAADTYVYGGENNANNQSNNYNHEMKLLVREDVGNTADVNRSYRAFLRFDLDSMPDPAVVEEAVFNIYAMKSDNETIIEVYAVADDDWNEAELNWLNKPQYGEKLGQFPVALNQKMGKLNGDFKLINRISNKKGLSQSWVSLFIFFCRHVVVRQIGRFNTGL